MIICLWSSPSRSQMASLELAPGAVPEMRARSRCHVFLQGEYQLAARPAR